MTLPEGWKEVELGEICEVKKGTSITKTKITDGDVPVIAGGQQPAYYHNVSNRTGKTITISASGAYAGFINYFETPIFASDCTTIQSADNTKISTKYVYYVIKSLQSKIYSFQTGTGQPHVYAKDLIKIKIPLPPLLIQQKIISILENVEQAKEWRKEADELTKVFLKSVFHEMFGDIVNNKKFKFVKLKDVAIIERNSVTPDKINENAKYVGLEHLETGSGKIIQVISVSEGDLKSNKFSFDEDCILYGKLRPYLNKIALPDFKGICSTDIIPIRPIQGKSDKYFISHILSQPYYIKLATDRSVGANLPRLNPRELESFEIICPSFPLQHKFALIAKEVSQLKLKQKSSKEYIDNLFNVLIQKTFKGELV